MQASQVEDQAVVGAEAELLQAGDVALDEPRRHVRGLHFLAGRCNGRRDEIDTGHVPTVLRHVHRVRARAAAEVEGFAGSSGLWSLDQLLQLGRRDAGVPGLEAEPIHGPKHEIRDVVGHQRLLAISGWAKRPVLAGRRCEVRAGRRQPRSSLPARGPNR